MIELKLEKRTAGTGAATLQKTGKIPAVFYGHKEASTPVAISLKDFKKIWKEAGESTVITLTGLGAEKEALIHDVDFEPVSGELRHADFYVLEKGKKVAVAIPLNFIGVAPAVKELAGTLVKVLHEIEIECLPKDLPHAIDVDISSLVDFESQIEAKDITLPAGVTLKEKANEVVALVFEAKEEILEAAPAPDLSTIEVEKRGKVEVAEEGAASEEGKE